MKAALVIVVGAALGGFIGYLSPWGINEWQYWVFTAPACAGAGLIAGIAPVLLCD